MVSYACTCLGVVQAYTSISLYIYILVFTFKLLAAGNRYLHSLRYI